MATKGFLADAPVSPESCGMKRLGRRALRVLSAVAPLLLLAAVAPAPQPRPEQPPAVPSVGETPTAAVKNETRLRKLHLVRPDLIPYPIAFEVYC